MTCRRVNTYAELPEVHLATHLHSNTCSSFQTASNVRAVPRHAERNLWVDANGSKYRTGILHTWLLSRSEH